MDSTQTKQMTRHHIKLSSSELANIWTNYMNDTLAICTIGRFLAHVEDVEIKSTLEYALSLSHEHVKKLTSIFNEEQLQIPDGFSEKTDIILDSPRLYSDDFYLFYLQNIAKLGLAAYTLSLSNSARLDMWEYYTECLNESAKLLNKSSEIMLIKGTFIRSPFIPDQHKVEYVQEQSYLDGIFGKHRPMNVIEITNIYFNLTQNQLGRSLLMGFSQVAKTKAVREYFVRGRNIADKHVELFGSILSLEYLPSSSAWDTLPTDSTVAPFSEKLMMFHTITLIGAGVGHYGTSLGTSMRSDLSLHFTRIMAEVMKYAADGARLMIKQGWLEQPPHAVDRDKLAKQ